MMCAKVSSLNMGDRMSSIGRKVRKRSLRGVVRLFAPGIALVATLTGSLAPTAARAADTVVTGVLGSYTSGVWPFLIGIRKGFFDRHNIKPDVVFAPTAPGLVQ